MKVSRYIASLALVSALFTSVSNAQTVTNYALTGVANDTFVRNSAPNNNFGTNPYMIVGGWGDTGIGMFKMNMSAVPSLGAGDKAELWLYNASLGGSSQPTQIQVGLAGVQWNDNWTWNNGLSWYTSTIVTGNISAYGYWTAIDITASYSQLKSGALTNNGWLLVPVNTNNYFDFFASVDHSNTALRPFLRVTKVAAPTPSGIALKWPLDPVKNPYANRHVTQAFGVDWAGLTYCPSGVIKKHSGVDYRATAGTEVYAADSGYVKYVYNDPKWSSVVVLEHTKVADNKKFTTTYWHTEPYAHIKVGAWVNKGDPIAKVANLGGNTHFHLGLTNSAYYVNNIGKVVTGVGALPQSDCDNWPAFPSVFIDPENTKLFRFE